MKKNGGSIRMGPISLLTMVVVICLAVMTVLSVVTAQASYAFSQRQAGALVDGYDNETAAQEFVAQVDGALVASRAQAGTLASALPQIASDIAQDHPDMRIDQKLEGDKLQASFTAPSGRCLNIELAIQPDASYRVAAWKSTTVWNEDEESGESLWTGRTDLG